MDEKKPSLKTYNYFQAGEILGVGYTTVRRYTQKVSEHFSIPKYKTKTGHTASMLTDEHLDWIRVNLMNLKGEPKRLNTEFDEGYFYIVLLVPEFSKSRIKIGFTNNLQNRLSSHQCSAPTAELIKSWSCKRIWEGYLTDVVARHGKCIRTEVFDVKKLDPLFRDIETAIRMAKK